MTLEEYQMKKEKMIQEICEATVASAVEDLLKCRGLSCETKRNFKNVTMNLVEKGTGIKIKTFYISYDNFREVLNYIRTFIQKNYPEKPSDEQALAVST